MFLSNLSIMRPVLATVLMLALVTLGIASYRRLPIDLYPKVEVPVISIVAVYPGASPETIEREVSKPIEEAVNPLSGVRHVGSTSREGVSQMFVEFELEVNPDRAVQDARARIAAIRGDLPGGMQEPIVEKIDIAGLPIVSLAVRSTSLSPRDLTTLVDRKVKRRLENVSGVGKIDLVGAVNREINVDANTLGRSAGDVTADIRRVLVRIASARRRAVSSAPAVRRMNCACAWMTVSGLRKSCDSSDTNSSLRRSTCFGLAISRAITTPYPDWPGPASTNT